MKNYLLTPTLIIACLSCSSQNPSSPSGYPTVYLDNSQAQNETILVETTRAATSQNYGSENYSFSMNIKVKNISSSTITLNISDSTLTRESSDAHYQVSCMAYGPLQIDSEISNSISFSSLLPSSISDENYIFSAKLNDFVYTVKLYETPDSERNDVTVSYSIGGRIVKTTNVKERRALNEKYIYESPSHLTNCSIWKTKDGTAITDKTIIYEDTIFEGSEAENLDFFELHGEISSYVQKVKYVPSDGVVVIPSAHRGHTVNGLSNFAIYQLPYLEKLYIPSTITNIYSSNFTSCPKLKAIYFEGTETQWQAIKNYSEIPSNVTIQYGVVFSNA